ncbi:hypothetical protein PUNSTDRAFT_145633 [Punctularia strigosozonata HHB-11173 SS5]|uniref:uncharacterized protein n=1 Tax=Punctularia strigosozonata (strain HHB-11173) TaxID=741275 RepID=UPI0004418438|nr:uncharacterized protein PUNSTDRAFT_145633 [Punctularia strigosozonata HHB-11173 SS5]EIN05673.1 hypothetical protein PUNSTDRAFT_145633 [Punctularia strigosozonata HHB-11173 SS5]
MSSIRNHRVVIASLFLPVTAALGDEPNFQPSPNPLGGSSHRSPPPLNLDEKPGATLPEAPSRANPAIKSIIEDLSLKSRGATPVPLSTSGTPGGEINPFVSPGLSIPTTPTGIQRPGAPHRVTAPLKSIVQDIQDKSRAGTPVVTPQNEAVNPFFRRVQHERQHVPSRVARKNSASLSRSYSRRTERSSSKSSLNTPTKERGLGWHLEPNPHANGGLRNAVDSVEDKLRKKLWVGTLGTDTDPIPEHMRKSIDKRMKEDCDSLPVWIPDAEFTKCYDEFCHQVLWPALHYAVPDAPKTKSFYESASWKQYSSVNQRFADAIIANYQDGDIIWVNDYHLMILPRLLRAALPAAPIGFFMHAAFPSSEIFRCLSVREHLLRGVLAADLIGFQTANNARHFRQTVSRILALEALPKGVQTEDRFVDVAVFPMGIDVKHLSQRKREPEVMEWCQILRQRYAGLKLLVGRDKLDEVQGVRQKLQAFEMFLEKHPEFHQKVVLIQIALPTTEESESHGGVLDVVARINSKFSTLTYQPVVFLHTQDLTFSQYLALLTVADAFIVTALREGMALRSHEFVECQEDRHRPLILSEFTGSYSYRGFRSCIAINPWDARGTADAIHQALTMSDEEATSRWVDLHNHVVAQTAQAFVTTFLTRCLRANIEHLRGDTVDIPALDTAPLLPRYKHSQQRLLLVDLEGTLWVGRDPRAATFSPPENALAVLKKLAEDKRNDVWLLSGLPVKGAMEKIAEVVPDIGMVAENGCFIRPSPRRDPKGDWMNMVANFDLSWKTSCMEILQYFTERTPGSYIEEREASVVWRFWNGPAENSADRQWARRQAAEAQNHIFDSIGERYRLRITPGANSFLVWPSNISRSTAVGAILSSSGHPLHTPVSPALVGVNRWILTYGEELETEVDWDFVLAISGDEKLLRRLNELDIAETCSTSMRGSDAKWRLKPEDAVKVLEQFANTA